MEEWAWDREHALISEIRTRPVLVASRNPLLVIPVPVVDTFLWLSFSRFDWDRLAIIIPCASAAVRDENRGWSRAYGTFGARTRSSTQEARIGCPSELANQTTGPSHEPTGPVTLRRA